MKCILFIITFSLCLLASFDTKGFTGPLLPSAYGIKNDGTLISQADLDTWLSDCKRLRSVVYFPAGKYLLPSNFEYDFGNSDLSILGDGPNKTILTTNNGPATNFAIPEKIDPTKAKPAKDGIYQVDIIAASLHRDFSNLKGIGLDSYIQITGGFVKPISLTAVKLLGYVTELDTREDDPGIDGLYVVAKHPSHDYGGGFAHLTLGFTGAPLYLQGTILQRKDGTWSRYYSSVAFISAGNFSVKNISFRNFRPYLFLPSSKKPQQNLTTQDHFIIENCKFENTARILATMTYAGVQESATWYKASNYYSTNWIMRFKNFIIRNSEFSYIHESVVWGAPPCSLYNISNNNIHDCYTMINCFYLFPQSNSALPKKNRSSFSITGNTFIRLRALNPGSENTVHLIRTMNKGIIASNNFIDCTGIHLYLNGAVKVSNNIIKTFMSAVSQTQARPPVILVKTAKDELISVSGNNILMGMMGNLIANESQASFLITNNKLIGPAIRYITSLTGLKSNLDVYRIYTVIDLAAFQTMAGINNYDPSIRSSNTVYYNKRNSRWENLMIIPAMYLYSEVNRFDGNKQHVLFANNEIETGYLTRIQKQVSTNFNSVSFENNRIKNCTGLNAGNDNTVISEYKFTGNTIKDGGLNMTSLGNVSTSIRSLNITGNSFFTDFINSSSFTASQLLIFQKNSFIRNQSFNFGSPAFYKNFGMKGQPAAAYEISLKGYPGQQLFIKENNFIAEMTRGNILNIIDPDKVEITENKFDLNLPSWEAENIQSRTAILFNAPKTVASISIERNKYFPENGKQNYLISFDESASSIINFLNAGNIITNNESAITKTVLATNKYFTNYFKGKNSFADKETISSVVNRLNKK